MGLFLFCCAFFTISKVVHSLIWPLLLKHARTRERGAAFLGDTAIQSV